MPLEGKVVTPEAKVATREGKVAPLEGKVALVTGAGRMSGTGHSIAIALARAGCDLLLHGRGTSPDAYIQSERDAGWRGPESVAEEVRALGRRAEVVLADIRKVEEVEAMFARGIALFGRLDILVNNAAAPRGNDRVHVVELTDELWHNVVGIKLEGGFYCSRAAARQMIKQGEGGCIINISSTAGKQALPNQGAYAASSAALQMLGAVMAKELGPKGIRVNSLCIGLVDSSRGDLKGRGEDVARQMVSNIPLGRAASTEDIGNVVAFLCSPAGSYITGQSINVDGGRLNY